MRRKAAWRAAVRAGLIGGAVSVRALVLSSALIALGAAPLPAQVSSYLELQSGDPGGFPVPVPLGPAAPEELVTPDLGESPLFGSLSVGSGPDSLISLAVARTPDGERLWVDADNDNALTPDECIGWEGTYSVNRRSIAMPEASVTVQFSVRTDSGLATSSAHLQCRRIDAQALAQVTDMRFPGGDQVVLVVQRGHRRGTIEMADRQLAIGLWDLDANGRWDDEDRLLLDVNGDGRFSWAMMSPESHPLGAPFAALGDTYRTVVLDPVGTRVRLDPTSEAATETETLTAGHPAPEFTGTDLDGRSVSLSDYRGRYVLLDFWASWCGPCLAEVPTLERALNRFEPEEFEEFAVLCLCLDQDLDRARRVIAQRGITWRQIPDYSPDEPVSPHGRIARLYHASALPTTLLIGPDGEIAARDVHGIARSRHWRITWDRAGSADPPLSRLPALRVAAMCAGHRRRIKLDRGTGSTGPGTQKGSRLARREWPCRAALVRLARAGAGREYRGRAETMSRRMSEGARSAAGRSRQGRGSTRTQPSSP